MARPAAGPSLAVMGRSTAPLRVVVAGGGFAAAELVLALRALAEDRVEIDVVAPSAELAFRPAATAAPFGAGDVDVYDLQAIAADAGASLRRDAVEAVAARAHRMRLASGTAISYDACVLAVGARARVGVPGAITFRDQRDQHLVARLIDEIDASRSGRLVFAAPAGVSWMLPLYELALLSAAELERRDVPAEIVMATPEALPMQVFGSEAGAHVAALLADRGIRRVRGAAQVAARGRAILGTGESISADGVVAVPRLVGRRLSGVPADWNGFVHTDRLGRVDERADVFAAGDMTSVPVKQGGLATQQADVIATVLAARAGADVAPAPAQSVLRARLLGADGPCVLRAELDADGRALPAPGVTAVSSEADWWPAAKLFGRHLTPWMAERGLVAQ